MLTREPEKEQRLLDWFTPAGTVAAASLNWLWWLDNEPYRPFLAAFVTCALAALAFEVGFKFFKVRQQRSAYFVLAFIVPLVLAVLGGIGGFLYARVV